MEAMNHEIIKSISRIAAVLAMLFLVMLAGKIDGTNSSFSNQELSSNNSFTAGTWREEDLKIQTENISLPETSDTNIVTDSTEPVLPPEEEVLPENPLPEGPVITPEETEETDRPLAEIT